MSSSDGPLPLAEIPVPAAPFRTIDLSGEARRIVEEQRRTSYLGLGIGGVFVVVGGVELARLLGGTLGPGTVIAILLIVLGGSLGYLSLRGGLWDPVARIDLAEQRVTFARRSGRETRVAWSDPRWELVIHDLAPDPEVSAIEKSHLFFFGPRSTYGSLGRADVGPLLDEARAHGLTVTVKNEVLGTRRRHTVRKLRIVPAGEAPSRDAPR